MSEENSQPSKPVQRVTLKIVAVFEHDEFPKQSYNFAGSFRPDGASQTLQRSVKAGTAFTSLAKLIPPGFVDSPGMIIVHVVPPLDGAVHSVRLVCDDSNHGLLVTSASPLIIQLEEFARWSLVALQPGTVVTLTVATR
jgi:hypothetical protein